MILLWMMMHQKMLIVIVGLWLRISQGGMKYEIVIMLSIIIILILLVLYSRIIYQQIHPMCLLLLNNMNKLSLNSLLIMNFTLNFLLILHILYFINIIHLFILTMINMNLFPLMRLIVNCNSLGSELYDDKRMSRITSQCIVILFGLVWIQ